MPDGGTVLLGGLKVSEKQEQRSGVPILNKIPIVRFLFERKGTYVSNRKLLILLKASIVIPRGARARGEPARHVRPGLGPPAGFPGFEWLGETPPRRGDNRQRATLPALARP